MNDSGTEKILPVEDNSRDPALITHMLTKPCETRVIAGQEPGIASVLPVPSLSAKI